MHQVGLFWRSGRFHLNKSASVKESQRYGPVFHAQRHIGVQINPAISVHDSHPQNIAFHRRMRRDLIGARNDIWKAVGQKCCVALCIPNPMDHVSPRADFCAMGQKLADLVWRVAIPILMQDARWARPLMVAQTDASLLQWQRNRDNGARITHSAILPMPRPTASAVILRRGPNDAPSPTEVTQRRLYVNVMLSCNPCADS